MLLKYGVNNYAKLDECKEKMKTTNKNKYDCEWVQQNETIRKKSEITNIIKYGYKNVMSVPDIREKHWRTCVENNQVNTSSQQIEIYSLLKNQGHNVELNYPYRIYCLDMMYIDKDIMINIEYDGGGHYFYNNCNICKDFMHDEYMFNNNIKVLRIKSRRMIPTYKEIINSLNHLLISNDNYVEIILNDFEEVIKDIINVI